MALSLTNLAANVAADAMAVLLNTGYLRIYSGSQPANADAVLAGNTLLAELRFSATAFGAAALGIATANAITADTTADASGTATFARLFKSDGTTVVMDCSVGTAAADIILNSVAISSGAQVAVTAFQVQQQKV
jgi:hypothetical protein